MNTNEVFNQTDYDWLKKYNQNDKQFDINEEHKPNLPKCCQNCPNNKNPFCNCVLPYTEMITY